MWLTCIVLPPRTGLTLSLVYLQWTAGAVSVFTVSNAWRWLYNAARARLVR